MRKSRFSEGQIVVVLKQAKAVLPSILDSSDGEHTAVGFASSAISET